MPGICCHDRGDFFAFLFEKLQVVAENLQRQRALGAGHRLADVVFDGLREVPDRARVFLHCAVHGGDQLFFVLVKYRTPLVMRLQVDEIFGVAESAGVGSIVRPADFGYHLGHFGKGRENIALVVGEFFAFRKTGAIRQSAARPDRAFVQMRQKLRSNDAAEAQVDRSRQGRPSATQATIQRC